MLELSTLPTRLLFCLGSVLLFSSASLSAEQPEVLETVRVDVAVYGGTPGGITAAIAAARDGASVILLEQTRHVGGLSTSGLNRDECNHLDRPTLGGLCEQFLEEAVKRSNGRWTEHSSRTWQSGIAEQVFLEMLKEAGVELRYEQLLDKVEKDGTRITELRVQSGESYLAKVFIDATYEGDLMAKAGVSYAVGRESADQYGESIAGVRYLDDKVAISPFDDDGKRLFGVMPGKPPVAGSASEVPICYNVRLNLTTEEANRVPIEKPKSYDPMQHELLARALEAGLLKNLTSIIGIYPMGDSDKRELNNRQFSIVSMSIPGAQTPWAEASFEEREVIHQKYRDYTHGMLWFLKSDPRVPEPIRDEMAPYGFCKDEWADNDHWPYYLYIRAARRMQGEIILTEADVIEDVDKEDVIHVGSHFIDCHHAARYVSDSGHIINEGRIWKVGTRFDIPYRAITPKVGECSNLLVPVCASASHVAFCTIRLEPTWMQMGEAAGIAAVMAGTSGKSVQEVDVKSLQARLLELGIPLEHPEGPMAYAKKHGKPKTFAPDDVVKEFFASADKDGDGMASKSEWDSARPTWKWLFDHMDKDKNGQLNRAEYQAFQDYKKKHPDWLKRLKSLGLRPGPNATILLNGKPYRGIGMNYFSCFLRTLKDGNDTSYDAGFATLAEKGIPFARFCATGFWPRDMKLYNEDRDEYFRRLDGVVASAEKHGIGLVPSLFWYYACVPDLVGEPMDQWGNPESKTHAWMRQYVREVVTRYRDNPTIWAWEFGNEYSLYADIPHRVRPKTHRSLGTPESRSKNDELTFDMVRKAFNAFGAAVKKYDPNRLVVTGDSFPRLAAWHLERHKSWEHDSVDQFKQMLIKANPDPINGISLHAYENDDQRFATAMEVARKLNKPIFIGEFGAQHETEAQAAKCRRLVKAIVDHGIPLAALWVFDHSDQKDFNIMPDNARAYQLDLIAEANRTLRKHADIDHSPVLETNPVKALADRVRGHVNRQPLRFPNQHWVRGTYYAGLMAMYESTSDRAYLDDCMAWGKQVSWRIKEQGGGPYESGAYPLICGQIWYGCYRAEKDEAMMRPTLAFLEDPKGENPLSAPRKWYLENTGHRFVDGLFTAPPTLAMLYQMTGDEKYVKWMDACFWDVHGEIFDRDAGLFYRDARSKLRKTKNEKKVLWSRGNGWAFGGMTRILKHLPEDHESYARYKALYVQMAESLAARQQDDGFWRPNLDDPEPHNVWESSGTGFFTYGIAWGINNGILDRDRFLPVAKNGWAALALVVNEDGQVGWSQPAGGGPGNVTEADTSKFGTGIFLLAASEIYQLELK